MSESNPTQEKQHEKFSLTLFALTLILAFAGLLAALWLLAPEHVWVVQMTARFWQYAAAFLAIELANCFLEYFFHRYILHKPVLPVLSYFYRQHTKHHGLTRIARKRLPGGREIPFVENVYPITRPEQREASFFPWYSLPVFSLLMTPVLLLLQWIWPSLPWFVCGYAAIAVSLALYEVLHAIEHWPLEKWAPLIESKNFSWFWRHAYSFHLRHHAVIDCNESISGFFALPVADWLFGTYVIPKTLYFEGEEWTPAKFQSPRPRWVIRCCDRLVNAIVKARRAAHAH